MQKMEAKQLMVEMAQVQTIEFKARNNFGVMQRLTGIFSRKGIRLQEVWFRDEGDNTAFVCIRFEGSDALKKVVGKQLEKMLDYCKEGE